MSVVEAHLIAPAITSASDLNLRQKSFVDNLLVCKIKWKAAKFAGYQGDPDTLSVTANELLRNPKIQVYYNECLESLAINPREILAEIGEIARAPWKEFVEVVYDDEGNVIPAQLKLSEKLKALEMGGKYHGMFIDRTESVNLDIKTEVDPNDMLRLLLGVLGGGDSR